jgi:hypothetical protein
LKENIVPTFQDILNQIKSPKECFELRQRLIKEIEGLTERPLILYAADFEKGGIANNSIDFSDKTRFSDLIENISGPNIDIFLHSPGGLVEAAEVIVKMLRGSFVSVRFIIGNSAKSAATMMALASDSILMHDKSELGPIDPQIRLLGTTGVRFAPAHNILEGFRKAKESIKEEGAPVIPAYVPLLNQYSLDILELCNNATELSKRLAKEWLTSYMRLDDQKAIEITEYLANHENFLSHGRSIDVNKAMEMGLNILDLSYYQPELGKKIWQLWCAVERHFQSPAIKLFENTKGVSLQENVAQAQILIPTPVPPAPPPEEKK